MNRKSLFALMAMLVMAMMSVGLASCGDDDDDFDGTVSSSEIKGSWKCTKATQSWSTNGGVNNMLNKTITFSSSGYSMSQASRPFYSSGTYNISSNMIWVYPFGMSYFAAKISVNNGTMRIKGYDGANFDYTFKRY